MKYILIILGLIIFLNCANAQYTWQNLDTASGLFNNKAHVIECDKNNNIWVALGSGSVGQGLDKFIGHTWSHYDMNNCSIPSNAVRILKCDTTGNLWMSFYGGFSNSVLNLTKFDGTNWTSYDTTNSNIISNFIYDIYIDEENNIWISCQEGISKFDGNTFINYPLSISPEYLIVVDTSNIWFSYKYGLAHYNPITNTLDTFTRSNSNIPSYSISALIKDENDLLWLGFNLAFNSGIGHGGTNGGLATFDGTTFTPIWPFSNPYTGVYGLTIDLYNNIWVSTRCEGLYKYDGTTWVQIQGVPTNGCSFAVTADKSNYIWYTEVNSGVWTNNLSAKIQYFTQTSNLNIYPVPSNEKIIVEIDTENLHNSLITIYNIQGQLLMKIPVSNKSTEIDISELSKGIYIVKLNNNKNILINKIIKN